MKNIDALHEILNALIGNIGGDTESFSASNKCGKWAPTTTWVAKPADPSLLEYARRAAKPQYKEAPGLGNAIKAHSRTPEMTARMGR